jgi:hypothetical protein
MKRAIAILFATAALTLGARAGDNDKPDWAYAVPPPATAPAGPRPAPDLTPMSIPGSKFHFTRNKVQGASDDGTRTRVQPADWFPEEHPNPIPPIIAMGDQSRGITPCSLCHMPKAAAAPKMAASPDWPPPISPASCTTWLRACARAPNRARPTPSRWLASPRR